MYLYVCLGSERYTYIYIYIHAISKGEPDGKNIENRLGLQIMWGGMWG